MLSVCLNPAWQKTLLFDGVRLGSVNRALELHQCGGGKGVNLARALGILGEHPQLALFEGGPTGDLLQAELAAQGTTVVSVRTQAQTRTCTTVVDHGTGQVTELIEPSGSILPDELAAMDREIRQALPQAGGVAICGTLPPGVPDSFYADIVRAARAAGLPVLLDGYRGVRPALREGPTILKINAAELRHLTGRANLEDAALECLAQYPVQFLAITDGPRPASLFTRQHTWEFVQPELPVRNAIGAGDCASGAFLLGMVRGAPPADAFRYALAAANASCLTDTPATFQPATADALLDRILVQRR